MGSIPATGQIHRVAICITCCYRGRRTCTCGHAAELASADSTIYTEPAPTRSRPKPPRIVENARTHRPPAGTLRWDRLLQAGTTRWAWLPAGA